ncbi:Receptor-like kinase [Quillaja saponaria]|uniref:Receptor-like kinase n=1 Tax=Quillaja saponaria TaxID=32244 RepID=A0AAD7Q950_QUISA|nr:Receptor-like kinase [Quillaja saponaria]
MTGHLLVKSDVYSYGVVLLELLTGRKPVDMSQPPGQENLVTWARPLLTSREGVEQLVDPTLAGSCDFDDMAKVASIASMCVHPEVTHRPFMGEVVQALKLIYNDTDEISGDFCSQKESSAHESDLRGDLAPFRIGVGGMPAGLPLNLLMDMPLLSSQWITVRVHLMKWKTDRFQLQVWLGMRYLYQLGMGTDQVP